MGVGVGVTVGPIDAACGLVEAVVVGATVVVGAVVVVACRGSPPHHERDADQGRDEEVGDLRLLVEQREGDGRRTGRPTPGGRRADGLPLQA